MQGPTEKLTPPDPCRGDACADRQAQHVRRDLPEALASFGNSTFATNALGTDVVPERRGMTTLLAGPHAGGAEPDGRLALIDAETLRPDLTGLPDLTTLACLGQAEGNRPLHGGSARHTVVTPTISARTACGLLSSPGTLTGAGLVPWHDVFPVRQPRVRPRAADGGVVITHHARSSGQTGQPRPTIKNRAPAIAVPERPTPGSISKRPAAASSS